MSGLISSKVVIMTEDEYNENNNERFQRGVERGRYDTRAELRPVIEALQKRVKDLESRLHKHENYEP